jgi:hypothetical protein
MPDLGSVIFIDLTGDNKPVFTSRNLFKCPENQTEVGIVHAGSGASYAIAGGADADMFNIKNDSGLLSFVFAPNFEDPSDINGENIYNVIVQASLYGACAYQEITVLVTDVDPEGIIIPPYGG